MMIKRLAWSVGAAVLLIGTAAALKYAQGLGLVDAGTVKRVVQVMIGLMLAAYSNLMPKDVGTWPPSPVAAARAQSMLRVGGWSLTLAGLVHAGLWAFAPLDVANIGSTVVVATAMVITMGYGARTLLACRASR